MSAQQETVAWVPTGPSGDTFGGRLRILRYDLGDISVREAATRCGFPTPTWRNWEKKGTAPTNQGEVARKIHQATGVDMAWLVFGSVPSTGPGTPSEQEFPVLGCEQQTMGELIQLRADLELAEAV